MTKEILRQAQEYVKQSLASQKRLGYSTRVNKKLYDEAVNETARALTRLQRASRRAE